MNIIPEGKEQIYVEATYKEPIEGVPFSNIGLTVAVSKYIEQGTEAKELDKQIQRLVKEYFDKLAEEMKGKADSIKETRNELVDKLRVEIADQYDEKLKKAKEIILAQREEIKLLKNK
jgi:hypothetical protein